MPIEARVDHARHLVITRARGVLTDAEVFGHQREMWSRPDVAGYDELVDMTQVEKIALPSVSRVRDLAEMSAGMDVLGTASKFAIVAPQDIAFGLGRMYEQLRELDPRSTRRVSVFRTMDEALAFLGVTGPLEE